MNIEIIYQEIAQYILDSIKDEWKEAWIKIEFIDQDISIVGKYIQTESGKILIFPVMDFIIRKFELMREIIKKPNLSPFQKAKFSLKRNGEFDIKIDYSD